MRPLALPITMSAPAVSAVARPVDMPRGGLVALCTAQLSSWGILYYALLVSVGPIGADTGWSATQITGAFSIGLVVSAVVGLWVGRLLDRRGPRLLMTLGSAVGACGLVVVSAAPDLWIFTAGWVVSGAAGAAVLYQPAFAVVTRWYGERRLKALTLVTLVGGLASTLYAPLTAFILEALDWRATFLLLAGVLAVVTIPLHWFFLNPHWTPLPPAHAAEVTRGVRSIVVSRQFVALELAVLFSTVSIFTVTLSLIPLLVERGASFAFAAVVLGVVGAGQVLGRIAFAAIPRRGAPWVLTMVLTSATVVAVALLAAVPGPQWLVVAIAFAAGGVRGCLTLLQATAVSDRWGTRDFGTLSGIFAAPLTAVGALVPVLGPVIAGAAGGYVAMAFAMAALALVGVALSRAT